MAKKASKELPEKLDADHRVPSGIPGLDKLIGGGFISGDTYLLTGGTGTCKTLFCCQFIYEGLKKGEKGVYFTLEESPEDIMVDSEEFGWDLKRYIKEKKLILEYQDPFELVDVASMIKSKIKQFNAKRVVVDSTAVFGMIFKDKHELRKRLYELIKLLKETDAVIIMTSEVPEDMKALSRFGVEEFVVDGVIMLNYLEYATGGLNRSLIVRKMRRTKHGEDIYPLEITKDGLSVKKS
jgi:circadian clock protein KaiC